MDIAVISFDTFTPGDLPIFDKQVGISGAPDVTRVALPGAVDQPGDGTGEVALDLQVIRGIAPLAHITNYEGPNTTGGMVPLIARIVSDGKAKIISNSWGSCENRINKQGMAAEDKELAAAFAAGISYFSASGDDAAYDCRSVNISANPFERDISPSVDWPAASANVIAVGGTFLTVREDGTYYDEAGWEQPLGGLGSGGGLSKIRAAAVLAAGHWRRQRAEQRATARCPILPVRRTRRAVSSCSTPIQAWGASAVRWVAPARPRRSGPPRCC